MRLSLRPGKCRTVVRESRPQSWAQISNPIFLADGKRFIWFSERTGARNFRIGYSPEEDGEPADTKAPGTQGTEEGANPTNPTNGANPTNTTNPPNSHVTGNTEGPDGTAFFCSEQCRDAYETGAREGVSHERAAAGFGAPANYF